MPLVGPLWPRQGNLLSKLKVPSVVSTARRRFSQVNPPPPIVHYYWSNKSRSTESDRVYEFFTSPPHPTTDDRPIDVMDVKDASSNTSAAEARLA